VLNGKKNRARHVLDFIAHPQEVTLPEIAERGQIGRYRILNEIGRGGYCIVYAAEDSELGRPVALKVLRQAAIDPQPVKRFQCESRIAAGLQHPNIVPVYDVGEAVDGEGAPIYYLVMELVRGGTLADLLNRPETPTKTLIALLEQSARAVEFAHQKGIVHRDLKPGNILVDPAGNARLTDFGLARLLESSDSLTRSHQVAGTPVYMSPEQIQGRCKDLDGRSDVYSLGVILYEILAKRLPFQAKDWWKLQEEIVRRLPPPPHALVPGVSSDAEAICFKALEKRPEDRYPAARALAQDLRRYLEGRPVAARPISRIRRLARQARRSTIFRLSLIALGVVVITSVVGYRRYRESKRVREREALRAKGHIQLGLAHTRLARARLELRLDLRSRDSVTRESEEHLPVAEAYTREFPGEPQGYFLRAQVRRLQGDYKSCVQDLREAIRLRSDFRPGWTLLGVVLLEEVAKARVYFAGDRRHLNRPVRLRQDLVEAFSRGSSIKQARIEYAHWGLDLTPEDEGWLRVATCVLSETESSSVLDRFRQERKAERASSEILELCFAAALMEHNQPQEAGGVLGGLVARFPGWAEAHELLASNRFVEGDIPGALRSYEEMLRRSKSFEAYYGRGICRVLLKEDAMAIESLDSALRIEPDNWMALTARAQARRRMGLIPEAFDDLEKSLRILPTSDAFFARSQLWYEKREFRQAIEDATEAIRFDPKDSESYCLRGRARHQLSDREGAIADYSAALEGDSKCLPALAERARVYGELERYGLAISDLSTYLQIQPKEPSAWYHRALCRKQLGEDGLALEDLNACLVISEKNYRALALRGWILESRGDRALARRDYLAAVAHAPEGSPEGTHVKEGLKRLGIIDAGVLRF